MSSATKYIGSIVVGALLAACGVGVQSDSPTTVQAAIDLSAPELLVRLGVPEPTIDWERAIDRLRYAGDGSPPTDGEVSLVSRVIDGVPTALLAKIDVRYVIRATDATVTRPDHPAAVAYALGPDIYLLDRAFALSVGGSTRFDLARAVGHELVHIAQYQTMADEYVELALAGDISQVNPIDGSQLVADFAQATGWQNESDFVGLPAWKLPPGIAGSSAYGAIDPGEDMAEAIALIIMGLADLVPTDRVRWVEQWLGAPADALALGQPWAPAGSVEVLAEDPLYDTDAVAALRGSLTHVEPMYFELTAQSPSTDNLVDLVQRHLRARVMTGTLERIDNTSVPRFGGAFTRPDGTWWWVELWDFRDKAPGTMGPNAPILTYVAIW